MSPYAYTDGDGTRLEARRWPAGQGVTVAIVNGDLADVHADDLPGVFAGLCAEAGIPVPVVLGRPEIDPAVSAELGPLGVWLAEGGDVVVAFGSRSTAVPLEPAAALEFAALVAAYAEARILQEAVPSAADVDALAAVLMEGNPTVMGLDGARPTARRILAAGYRLEAGNG
jgi:hypothetical protein